MIHATQRFSCSTFSYATIAIVLAAGTANAEVTAIQSETSLIGPKMNNATFNNLSEEDSLSSYNEDGLLVDVDASAYLWNAPGMSSSSIYYANTGTRSLIDISLVSGGNFESMEFQYSTGWDANNITTVYLWVQVWDNGDLMQELDIDGTSGGYLALTGGDFDLVRVGSYATAAERDAHIETRKNAIVLDNISNGTLIPAPSGAAVLAFGALAATRRRRA